MTLKQKRPAPKAGVCQWFHYWDELAVEQTIELLAELGCTQLRTGISWADFHRPQGRQWYRRQMRMLADAGLDILVSVWHTPPSLSESSSCSGPPCRIDDYIGFIWEVLQEYGDCFDALEIWNEPNNRVKWNFVDYDPDWSKFARLLAGGAREARRQGMRTVLGGIIPVDPDWLRRMESLGALDVVDVLAFHDFPGMWWLDHPSWDWASHWRGWKNKVDVVRSFAEEREVWVTETGLATWDVQRGVEARFDEQQRSLLQALASPAERVFW